MLERLTEGDIFALVYVFVVLALLIVTFFVSLWWEARTLRKYRQAVLSWLLNSCKYSPTVAYALLDRFDEDVRNAKRRNLSTLHIAKEISKQHKKDMRSKESSQ